MKELGGKTAFVTGAASGIGLGMARAFVREGMAVAMCDIREAALAPAAAALAGEGARVIAIPTDVSERASIEAAADKAEAAFGPVQVVCNNAGVAMRGPAQDIALNDWNWVIAVNLYGVIHGVSVFVPRMKAHGLGGHIVNTASIGGFQLHPEYHSGAYAVTKFGVAAFSESLAFDLAGSGIGISVLAPAAVDTHIYATADSRPDRFGGPTEHAGSDFMRDVLKQGLSGDEVGERVVEAIKGEELFVFTHPDSRAWVEARHRRIMEGFDHAERWAAANRARHPERYGKG